MLPNELQALVWIIKKDAFEDMGGVGRTEVNAAWQAFNTGAKDLKATHAALWAAVVKDQTRKADAKKAFEEKTAAKAAKAAARAAKREKDEG